MKHYKVMPGRRSDDGWLVALESPGDPPIYIRSYPTWAEARGAAVTLAAIDPEVGAEDFKLN
jgi:hypothetical protein